MAITVRLAGALNLLAEGKKVIECEGNNIAECIDNLNSQYPGFKVRLCDKQGNPQKFINIYINGDNIRYLHGVSTPLRDGDELSIIPAVAGG